MARTCQYSGFHVPEQCARSTTSLPRMRRAICFHTHLHRKKMVSCAAAGTSRRHAPLTAAHCAAERLAGITCTIVMSSSVRALLLHRVSTCVRAPRDLKSALTGGFLVPACARAGQRWRAFSASSSARTRSDVALISSEEAIARATNAAVLQLCKAGRTNEALARLLDGVPCAGSSGYVLAEAIGRVVDALGGRASANTRVAIVATAPRAAGGRDDAMLKALVHGVRGHKNLLLDLRTVHALISVCGAHSVAHAEEAFDLIPGLGLSPAVGALLRKRACQHMLAVSWSGAWQLFTRRV